MHLLFDDTALPPCLTNPDASVVGHPSGKAVDVIVDALPYGLLAVRSGRKPQEHFRANVDDVFAEADGEHAHGLLRISDKRNVVLETFVIAFEFFHRSTPPTILRIGPGGTTPVVKESEQRRAWHSLS